MRVEPQAQAQAQAHAESVKAYFILREMARGAPCCLSPPPARPEHSDLVIPELV